jgi:hypothetical protein
MKKGYYFRDLGKITEGNYHFDYKFLVREKDTSVAGILAIVNTRYILTGPKTYFLGIPVGNLMSGRFDADLNAINDNNLIRAYTKTVSAMAADFFALYIKEMVLLKNK